MAGGRWREEQRQPVTPDSCMKRITLPGPCLRKGDVSRTLSMQERSSHAGADWLLQTLLMGPRPFGRS